MENPSDPAKPSLEEQPTYVRPPGLEFGMGLALSVFVFVVFFLVQSYVFFAGVIERSPDLAPHGFSIALFEEPAFHDRMQELIFHGDLVAHEALWSGLIGSIIILVAVALWKRRNMRTFLGLYPPRWKAVFKWLVIFLLLGAAIEILTRYTTLFESDFMARILATSSDRFLLWLGVGLMAPLFEELLLRGLLFGSIRHLYDEHITVAVTAGVFAVMHQQYEIPILMMILAMGVVLGYARSRSGSIYVPVLLHVLNNTASVLLPVT